MKHASRVIRHSWWAVGLAIVLLMLVHDVAMALPNGAAHHQPATGHHASDVVLDDPQPAHPTDCGVALPAIVPHAAHTHFLVLPPPSTTIWTPETLAPSWSESRGWEEPAWPPGVRRALLQVYRV